MAALSLNRRRSGAAKKQAKKRSKGTWFEQLMAAIALINLILVLFDLSYIRFRDLYLDLLPAPTVWYGDRFKGIEPERTTVKYLALVDDLKQQMAADPDLSELQAQALLSKIRTQSEAVIDENPFAIANKSGTLERIKNLMRDRVPNEADSSKQAFRTFWSTRYLQANRAPQELAFFDREIRPLMATNYFRSINESGSPTDLFWQIDLAFIALFAAEFLARTYVLSRRHARTTWIDAMLWRIYDLPLLIGFWRWLRVIPVTMRLHQARWINLEPIRNRLSRAVVSQFAVELTEIVLLRMIDQGQRLIKDGDITRWLMAASDRSRYVDINGVDEVQAIAKHLSDVVIYQVLPKIKPELDALLQHTVISALQQAPAYQGLKFMPGFDSLSAQISHQVVSELSKTLTETLQSVFADEQGGVLTNQLLASFSNHLRQELQTAQTMDEVRGLINDLLEEIKINYVEGIGNEDTDQIEASRYRLYGASHQSR
ncbi:MAG: hypothetical protein DCF15_16075 [Phormidesmis priestleyi]|uniref:Uncharacterized protein n=1 Tax=Phormidesmis priestleyi TaxID=268141 RepID=A0A2W4X0U8_9CYAN|nr:MAG: hypothetical protein DCF15_16075 [Phormidesmis priestleyi]